MQPRPPSGFQGLGVKLQNEALCVRDRSELTEQKARESGELNLEVRLESCSLLLLGGSFNTSKKAMNKNFDINLCGPLDPEALGQTSPSAPPSQRSLQQQAI